MSFRFWRRIKITPGVTLNLSKSGGLHLFIGEYRMMPLHPLNHWVQLCIAKGKA